MKRKEFNYSQLAFTSTEFYYLFSLKKENFKLFLLSFFSAFLATKQIKTRNSENAILK